MFSERIGKYLSVERSHYQPRGGKTTRWRVLGNGGDYLGTVAWFGRWRQYTFDPVPQSSFNRDCLLDIAAYLERINAEHRKLHRPPDAGRDRPRRPEALDAPSCAGGGTTAPAGGPAPRRGGEWNFNPLPTACRPLGRR